MFLAFFGDLSGVSLLFCFKAEILLQLDWLNFPTIFIFEE